MFVSFFPRPRLFFWSALLWTALCMAVWYGFAGQFFVGPEPPPGLAKIGRASCRERVCLYV